MYDILSCDIQKAATHEQSSEIYYPGPLHAVDETFMYYSVMNPHCDLSDNRENIDFCNNKFLI